MKYFLLIVPFLLASCSTSNMIYAKQEALGVHVGVDAATQTPRIGIGTASSNLAKVPVIHDDSGSQIQSTRETWFENGNRADRVIDALSACGTFDGDADAEGSGAQIAVESLFATGGAAQTLCDSLREIID